MSVWQEWLRRPQNFWVRRVLFQVHLWTGISAGLYILVMSLTGVVLIYRRSLTNLTSYQARFVQIAPHRLTVDELKQAAQRVYPGYEVEGVYQIRNRNRPVEIDLMRGDEHISRVFNPYTGADMGPSLTLGFRALTWTVNLHDNLLLGHSAGRDVNAFGGILVLVMTLTGLVIWWPGLSRWRESLGVNLKGGLKKFNWSLHSAMGIWFVVFTFMWAFTGVYLSIPGTFNSIVNYFDPGAVGSGESTSGDRFLAWLARIHFGQFAGLPVVIIWTIAGLVPLALFITGALMWWSRVLNPWLKRAPAARASFRRDQTALPQ